MSRIFVPLCVLPLVLAGCKKVEAAPKELDDLFHWFWSEFDEGSDEQLAEGLRNLHDVVDGDSLDEVMDGSISKLSDGEANTVDVRNADGSKAAGIFLVRPFACKMGRLEKILYDLDQDELYPGSYDRYDRDYVSDLGAYKSREDTNIDWETDYTATLLGASFDARVDGGLRRVAKIDGDQSPYGAFIVARAWMPRPADFENKNKSLDQDYQIEIFWRQGGRMLHAYGMWREADFGSGYSTNDEGVQRILLNNLSKWDDQTEENCAAGLP